MNLSQQFHPVTWGQIVQIQSLEINKTYPVLFARRLITQFGPPVLVTMQSEEGINVKIYLPKIYSDVFEDSDIEDINTGRKHYKIIYRRRTGSAYVIHSDLQ